jgi:uncharacterized protein (TIGR02996 family)
MTRHHAFIQSIAETLYDDTPRLIYADWLEEHGESEPGGPPRHPSSPAGGRASDGMI